MVMMTKKPTSAVASLKLIMVIPVISVVFLAISAYKEIPEQSENKNMSGGDSQKSSQTEIRTSQSILYGQQTESDKTVSPPPPPPPPPQQSEEVADEPDPYVVVEEMPQFPGGDTGLLKFLGENTVYPESAKEKNLQGRVIVRFCVTAAGGINQVSVLKGVSPDLDMEAMRVVKTLPAFEPGRQGGKPVPVWYMVPITFTLR
jgi:TonB family protein